MKGKFNFRHIENTNEEAEYVVEQFILTGK
jgi:hypothetical protein